MRWVVLAWLLPVSICFAATSPQPGCLREVVAKRDLREMVAEAVGVLRACGYDPAAYDVELALDDPLTLAGTGRQAGVTVMFEPHDARRLHALAVSADEPCSVAWVWRPDRFSGWQRRVLERVQGAIAEARASRDGTENFELRVTETRDHLAVRWWWGTDREAGRAIVLSKENLAAVDPGRPEVSEPRSSR